MPWKSGTIMDNRLEFVRLAQQGGVSVAELCRRFSISRETGFQYLRRYRENGVEGLKDRSRRPHSSPERTAPEMETRIVAVREAHPWGGRKLGAALADEAHYPARPVAKPCSTTIMRCPMDPAPLVHRISVRVNSRGIEGWTLE
jgi:transposase-like protein